MRLIRIPPRLCHRAVSNRRGIVYSVLLLIVSCLSGCRDDGLRVEQAGEMVMYGLTSRIPGFDPVRAGDVSSSRAISKIYEGLLQYSYVARPYQLEPNLAESMPEVSPDGLTYTFRIRKGIFFQDDPCFVEHDGKGRELTANDFVYSIKRVADIKNESSGYWAFRNKIPGLDKFREASKAEKPTDYSMEVEGLKAENRYTFKIRLKHSYPQLLWVLAMHYAYAVPREAVEYYGDRFLNNPVGTGPYILKSWRRNYRVVFVRNPKWKETGRVEIYPEDVDRGDVKEDLSADTGKPIPFIDRIVQYVIDDGSTAWLKFVTGDIEFSGISRNNWDAVITQDRHLTGALNEKGIRLYKSPTLDVFYIGFNMDDPVVGSSPDPETDTRRRKLRQALTCAFNSKKWVQFYNNRIIRARGPIPPGVKGRLDEPS
ncbi:MAG: ABC transporter substrate-binding protein, partial [Verrucomicrobiota bacterium]